MKNQRGSALALAVFVLVILSGLGLSLLFMTENEQKMGRSDLLAKQAFSVAEAGVEHARLALYVANKGGSFDDDLEKAAGGTAPWAIDFDPLSLQPTFDAGGILTGFSAGVGDDVPLVPLTPFAGGAYAAYLTNDPVDTIGSANDGNGRVMITAVGGAAERSLEIVQAIVEFDPIVAPPPPAAITLIGPSPAFTPGNSNAKLYDGNDCGGSGIPGLNVPTVGVIGSAAATDVRNNMGKPTYRSGKLPPEQTVADLTNTGEPAVTTPIDLTWTDCPALRDMIEEIRTYADIVCTSHSCTLPPSSPSRVVFVDGDFNLSGGSGLMVVTGRLNFTGNVSWDGLLLVVGEGNLQRSGGGSGLLSGSIVVADIAGADQVYGTADDCKGGDGGFEPANFQTNGGGNSTVGYCNANIDAATPQRPYKIVSFLQR